MLHPAYSSLVILVVIITCCSRLHAQTTHQLDTPYHGGSARMLTQQAQQDVSKACRPLSKALLSQYAKHDIIMVAITDRITAKLFGTSWVDNVEQAGISYWMVAALDPETSRYFGGELGVRQCFDAPPEILRGISADTEKYQWGSTHWAHTTWLKVHLIRAVYALGFHVLHCDLDTSWFRDPIDFFVRQLSGPAQLLTSTDQTSTRNKAGDEGVEVDTGSHTGINTGVYFLRQCPEGMPFLQQWLSWQHKMSGHDQDGLQLIMRGVAFSQDGKTEKHAITKPGVPRVYYGALNNAMGISYLPASMFANQYTYVNGRFHELRNHTLYEVHWVWGGNTLEAKRQSMRDALKFVDPPEYYSAPDLVSIEIEHPATPEGFNKIKPAAVESMIQYHHRAVEYQLQQLYYGFAMGVALNRTVILPRILCFCSKNWYMTRACRLDPDRTSQFPFVCGLAQVLRAKRLTRGVPIPHPPASGRPPAVLQVREYSFLENRHTPAAIKKSRLVVQPTVQSRGAAASITDLRALVPPLSQQADGTPMLSLPWPLTDVELQALLAPHSATRVMHFVKPSRLFGPVLTGSLPSGVDGPQAEAAAAVRGRDSFVDKDFQFEFDKAMYAVTAYWCCRAPSEMKRLNATVRIELDMVPWLQRQAMLARATAAGGGGEVKRGHDRSAWAERD